MSAAPAPELYTLGRDHFIAGVAGADTASAVPACPEWTLHDLLAHQLHQLEGMCDGSFPLSHAIAALIDRDATARAHATATQQAWIDAGLAGWRDTPSSEVIEKWVAVSDRAAPDALSGLVPDLAVHVLDLDGAIDRDSGAVEAVLAEALEFWGNVASTRAANLGRGGLRITTPDGRTFGSADAEHVVVGTTVELLLTITGRRDRAQASARLRLPTDATVVESIALYGWPRS